jgi:predicted dienelactone hydrolase
MRAIAKLAAVLMLVLSARAWASEPATGFQHLITPNGTEVGVWYPSTGTPVDIPLGPVRQSVVPGGPIVGEHLPLVVISHGTGGSFTGHTDTAVALANAGFVVAALTHPGDNWRDQSRRIHIEDRPTALSGLIDFMLDTWAGRSALDPARIGAFGFSAGGFTVLAGAGGKPDLTTIETHCKAHPDFYDCRLLADQPRDPALVWNTRADRRIKALVVAAPALGFTFAGHGLDGVQIPVQLWRADADRVLPAPEYADAVRQALPKTPEFHHVENASHYDFLAPCNGPEHLPEICTSAPGFDRAAFHANFNSEVTRFLSEALRSK